MAALDMTLRSFAVNLSRILVCTVALLALGACSSGSSSGDSESASPDTTALSDSAAGPNTPPAGSPGTPPGDPDAPDDTPAPPDDTPSPPGNTPATPPGGEVSGNAQFLGMIPFAQTVGRVAAGFIKFSSSLPATEITDGLATPDDSCYFLTVDLSSDIDDDESIYDESAVVSGGQVITVRSAAGSFVDLVENTESGFSVYQPSIEEIPTPFPDDLIVDIPGNVFPAFANVAVPNVEPLVVTDDSGANGSYRWVAGNDPNAIVNIRFSVKDNSNPGTSPDDARCFVIDDGEFSIPASLTSQLPADYSITNTEFFRTAFNIVQSGDAVLIISNLVTGE